MNIFKSIGRIILSFFSSILISLILFLVIYSFLTKEFPPNLSKLKKSYENLGRLTKLSQHFLDESNSLDEDDVQKLITRFKERATLGEKLIPEASLIDPNISEEELKELKKDIALLKIKIQKIENTLDEITNKEEPKKSSQ